MHSRTILVVDDEPMIAEHLCESLQEVGYHLLNPVSTGAEALRQIETEPPDLVLMDINLAGELDGIATATAIQATIDCAIIYLTANTDSDTLQRAKHTHPFGYLIKPFRERELHAMVEISIYRHAEEKNTRLRQRMFEQTIDSTPEAIVVLNPQGQLQFMNPAAETLLGCTLASSADQPLLESVQLFHSQGFIPVKHMDEIQSHSHLVLKRTADSLTHVRAQISALHDRQRRFQGHVLNLTVLQNGAPESPHSMLTLCASCRHVRTPEGNFSPLDTFLRKFHQTRFSHGICPECFEQLYPQYLHQHHEG
jgi:PAS domain S-box-containing protein